MLELLSPAGSPEAVVAAVQSGADAVYMGLGVHNARRSAKNFTDAEFETAVRYCRVRGCKVYVTLNTLVGDRELAEAVRLAARASEIGADAVLVQDLGLARTLRGVLPELPLHASTQMSIHNLAGVEAAAEMGLTRAVLARELSLEQIAFIAARSPIGIEVFVHGALCFCHSGQCYMSAFIGRRSGSRGACAQPCRLDYSLGGRADDHPLSLKDSCLVSCLGALEKAGVACVKIEGRMKRPEYSAIVTGIYSRAIREGLEPTEAEMEQLELAFSRQGFTDGYLTGNKDAGMFGVRGEPDRDANKLYAAARRAYGGAELRRVPVKFFALIRADRPAKFAVEDGDGHKVVRDGPVPQRAASQVLTRQAVHDQFYKTGGTPYLCSEVETVLDEGLFLPVSSMNELRRILLEDLTNARKTAPAGKTGALPRAPQDVKALGGPKLIFQIGSADQLTEKLAAAEPDCLYVPLAMLVENHRAVLPFVERGALLVAVLPRVVTDTEAPELLRQLRRAKDMGVDEALLGNMGHIKYARLARLNVRGDFGLNIYNSEALQVLSAAGFLSATASFELRLSQIRDMKKPLNTEIIAYGRLPLMVSDQCIIKNSAGRCGCRNPVSLSDRTGRLFPVVREAGCRNVILNAHRLFLADRKKDLARCGLWGIRLLFTNEGPEECIRVADSYRGGTGYVPNGLTRGLYYRGVE
ncbi:MAG: U32 family peptidase [Oscillospiraceae bacterium]|jgi:putative protease|nr:U32 family peptidase [Oscillospiraceae bacterium]